MAAAAVPLVVSGRYPVGLGTTVALAAISALGYQVTWGLSGQLSVAHAPLAGVGAYTVARLTTSAHWSWWAAILPGVLLAAAFGALVGLPALRLRGDYVALVTLGAGEILHTLFLNSGVTGGFQGVPGVPAVLGGRGLYLLSVALLGATLLGVVALKRSWLGRSMRAVRDDEVAAAACGLSPGPLRLAGFAIGAGLAGLAGGLYATQNGFVSSVSFGLNQTVTVILIALVAGRARLGMTVVAAAGVTFASDRLTSLGRISEGVIGGLILAVVASRVVAARFLPERA